MMCRVKITEVREATVWVDVDYDFEATRKAEEMYNKGIVTTDNEDVVSTEFELDEDYYDED